METIKLPCGVTAEIVFEPSRYERTPPSWHVTVRGFMGVIAHDRDDAIRKMDAQCVEARAALLPPGAVVVEDTPETRETIARALAPHEHECLDGRMRVMATAEVVSAAVLAALGVQRG